MSTSSDPKRSMLTFQNSSSYTISTPSTKLSWVAIVCKLLNSLSTYKLFSSLHVIILIISFCTLLCRIKIRECKRKIYSVGFIDPDKVNIYSLTTKPDETASNLQRFLTEQHFCDHILFPYNFQWGSYSVVHIHFCLLDVKCNWWVTDVYINVCRFHWILLDIQVDKGIVEVMDPLKRPLEEFRSMQDMLQT